MAEMAISEFVDRVSEIMPVVMKGYFRQQAAGFHKLKITLPQFVVLDILSRHGESKMSDLAHFINVTTAAMTGIVDRLVRDGYLKRVNDPQDRRIIKVNLTSRGDKLVREASELRKQYFSTIFGMISQKEREDYLKILEHLRDHIQEQNH